MNNYTAIGTLLSCGGVASFTFAFDDSINL